MSENMNTFKTTDRNSMLDIFSGILILLTIVGHVYDAPIIFQFHMPLFFVRGVFYISFLAAIKSNGS